ncbi:T9SS type A sorting domain-containing protein [Hymenobacter terricola]|uniref:T9SS type A sorting domain-containing protein n=1 Tax=Hymenobacter terricola TaxID=2819236 RepID=UPI001B31161C|nr:T9SS type A sorting domain-containing protein [Hymenobacter terricola]
MKILTFRTCLFGLFLLTSSWAQGQGPTIDPTFYPGQVYQPGAVTQALRQPDGQTLLLGPFVRVAGQPSSQVARLAAGGTQVDPLFQTNVASLQGAVDRLVLLPNGKILLLDDIYYGSPSYAGPITVGGVSRQALLQLNADGTPDASFDANLSVSATLRQAVPQPDGKILLLGTSLTSPIQGAAPLVRLNPDGSLDASFQAAAFALANGNSTYPRFGTLQPDGKLLVAGPFATVGGQTRQGIARLLPTGALDPTFQAALPSTVEGTTLSLQSDGKVVLACVNAGPQWPDLRRLQPDGSADAGFQLSSPYGLGFSDNTFLPPVVQPDGRVVVATRASLYASSPVGRVVRFLASGALDSGFDNMQAATGKPNSGLAGSYPGSLQLLANGQLLVATGHRPAELFRYAPYATSLPVGLALLNSDGSRDGGFSPVVQDYGLVNDLVLQSDGKLVVGGSFSEVSGTAVRNVARLQANGLVDASFSAATDDVVATLGLQGDGKLLLGGSFGFVNGVARSALGRVLATGATDAAFAPPITGSNPRVQRVALQANGAILAAGGYTVQRGATAVARVLAQFDAATGQEDATFQPTVPTYGFQIQGLLPQPNGTVLVVGELPVTSSRSAPVWRLLPTGALDPAFSLPSVLAGDLGLAVAQDGAGRLYVTGSFDNLGAPGNHAMGRLLANGQPDPTFQVTLPGLVPLANTIVVQPNGRVLLGGALSSTTGSNPHPEGTLRLLPSGAVDTGFNPAVGPVGAGERNGYVSRLLVQPDGAILAAGSFPQVGSLPLNGLVRFTDTHVLGVSAGQAALRTLVWPVPAHDVVHVAFDDAGRPQQVELWDALGRRVRVQAVHQSETNLNIHGLPTGVYWLRIYDALSSPAARRIVVE